jgi:hypothetical protein
MSAAGSASYSAPQRARFAYAFLALALAVNVSAMVMHRRATSSPRRAAVDVAILADMTITLPLAYWLLVARPRRQSAMAFAAVAALSTLRGLSYQHLDPRVHLALGATLEIAIVAFVAGRVRAASRHAGAASGDPLERLRHAIEGLVPAPRVADVLAAEISVFLYAFGSWRSRPHVPAGAQAFTMHRRSGAATLFGVLAVMTLIESAVVHLIVAHWSGTAAWVLTGLSIYSAAWCVAMARALVLRPTFVESDGMVLRAGLLWTLRLRRKDIANMHAPAVGQPRRAQGYVRLTALTAPTLILELASPQTARGLLGIERRVTRVGIAPDDLPAFIAAVNA